MNSFNLKLGLLPKTKVAFSLVELMISLITISCIVAAFTPVITKKLKKQDIAISIAQSSEIFSPCAWDNDKGKFVITDGTAECEMCTSGYCILCNKKCASNQYLDSKACECKECSEFDGTDGNNSNETGACETCTKDGCTHCKETGTWSRGYTIENGKCKKCPESGPNISSNGVDQCAVPCQPQPGYYCDTDNSKKLCTSKYGEQCSTCTKEACLTCSRQYRVTDGGQNCEKCTDVQCFACPNSKNICTDCNLGYPNPANGGKTCINCYSEPAQGGFGAGCITCTSNKCTLCDQGYYLSTSTIHPCINDDSLQSCPGGNKSISNCLVYSDGKPECEPECTTCAPLYFWNGSGCEACAGDKYGSNCAFCDATNCLSCKPGYHLSSNTTGSGACILNNYDFSCSDSNVMTIPRPGYSGKFLCVTRKNMGDSEILSIPKNKVAVVNTSDETCYSSNQPCCWTGSTGVAGAFDNFPSGYKAKERTVCNYEAAKIICKNLTLGGLNWRLPANFNEISNWGNFSDGNNPIGLSLCDGGYLNLSVTKSLCGNSYNCIGAPLDYCASYRYMTSDVNGLKVLAGTKYFGGVKWYNESSHTNYGLSVRCVAELP